MIKAIVTVMPKTSVLDPQGAATAGAMKHFGLNSVGKVRIGRSIEILL
ncbi:MAG: phosphoribosylformylglycinamidine synthase subunit PurS, partial [Chthoniobacterales bacterium]